MKKISKFRSLTKERFLDALLAHLKSQANADFELIRKYEKARRFMEDDLDEDKIAGFRSQHWKEWDRWRDEVVEGMEDEQRAERAANCIVLQPLRVAFHARVRGLDDVLRDRHGQRRHKGRPTPWRIFQSIRMPLPQ